LATKKLSTGAARFRGLSYSCAVNKNFRISQYNSDVFIHNQMVQ